ncbi:MAG: radical SAM family heme chaperone HemW [Lentimicrobiaceae bacterium]|nr:radical SAM family heme chaperone HemW [Lentimicrobiaceae bacterium]
MKNVERYVDAVVKEVESRKENVGAENFLPSDRTAAVQPPPPNGESEKIETLFSKATLVGVDGEAGRGSLYKIKTIYFGGGTPTLLPIHSLEKIMNAIYENFDVDSEIECTIEGNPEQLSFEYLIDLKSLGFNRISIGIQSFNDDILHFLGRTHSGKDALFAIENAQKAGFENISVDLMYGINLRSLQDWAQELKTVFQLPVQHLSAYSLTVEENTLLYKKIAQQKAPNIDEEQSLQEMKLLIDEAEQNNFEHYEVSNFALKKYHSKHNSNYWNGTPYLGFGASAHSFTGTSRSWNISNVEKYMKAIEENEPFFEVEHLTPTEQYNEAVLLGLRTKNGIDLEYLETRFGVEKRDYLLKALQKIDSRFYKNQSHHISVTKEGLPLLDFITAEVLFM